jgi:hypothetical protein
MTTTRARVKPAVAGARGPLPLNTILGALVLGLGQSSCLAHPGPEVRVAG